MTDLRIDFSEFERAARRMNAARDQVPFALSKALNEAAEKTRTKLITKTWPGAVTVRNARFLNAALTTRGERATKKQLRVTIYDKLHRAHLEKHAFGGTKVAKGRGLAIPPSSGKTVRRTSRGVVKSQKPSAIIAMTPARSLRVLPHGIFTGEGGRLHLRYSFERSAKIRKDVPFLEVFHASMLAEARAAFPEAMARAMMSRKVR